MMFGDRRSKEEQKGPTGRPPEERIQEHLNGSEHAVENLEFAKAEKLIECAIEEADRFCAKNHSLRAITRKALADLAFLQKNYSGAAEILDTAIHIVAASPESPTRNEQLSAYLMHKADLYNELGRVTEAHSLWKSAMEFMAGDPSGICCAYLGTARSWHIAGDMHQYAVHMTLAASQTSKASTPAEQYEVLAALRHGAIKEAEKGRFAEAYQLLKVVLQGFTTLTPTDPDDISATVLLAATMSERAGNFDTSLQLRRHLLTETIRLKGEASVEVISLRNGIARVLCERGQFEAAEVLLTKNLAQAKQFGDTTVIVQAGLALVTAYREQGMYQDAATLVASIAKEYQNSLDIFNAINLLQIQAACRADYGDVEKATQLIDSALDKATEIEGPYGLMAQATLHTIRASLFTDYDREKAQESLETLEETLTHLPPGQEPLSSNEIKILSARINEDTCSSTITGKAIKEELKYLSTEFGTSKNLKRADLMFLLARFQRKDDPEAALETLEQARILLEEHKRTTTTIYGAILRELSEMLPPEEPRAAEYERIAELLLNKIPKQDIEDPDSEDPFDTDRDEPL